MSVIWVQVTEQTFACSFSELYDDLRVFRIGKSFFLKLLLMHIFLKVGDKSVEKQGTSTYLI